MRHLLLILALFALAGCSPTTPSAPPQSAGKSAFKLEKLRVLDVRSDEEWAEGHLAGVQHLPLDLIRERITSLVPDKQTPLGVYCASGARSSHAARLLKQLGYENVEDLGGYNEAQRKLANAGGTP